MSMDGMDKQYWQMRIFHDALARFNESLRSSVAELEAEHEKVSPYWQDQWRKDYDSIWGPFEETMKRYINSAGPNYVAFLEVKIRSIGRYLNGD